MAHKRVIRSVVVAGLGALVTALAAPEANACGGFFCGRQPVDQTAERILFEVGADTVTMTTQISFTGEAPDFAWVLPLGEVPLEGSLAVFPQRALNALDANTGPTFNLPNECYALLPLASSGVDESAESEGAPPVTVYIRQEVGEYDVAVIESEDPAALVEWLRGEGYRITDAMVPYVERYTSEGLKFLALKLLPGADVTELSPFRFTLPGTTPTIPLRMTALAAEPEMSIVSFVLANERFEGKNWANLEIPDDQIRYNPNAYTSSGVLTNWPRLVAQAVDTAGGQGWVTEFAGPSASYAELVRQQVQTGNFATEDDAAAATELLGVLERYPYLTRLYTRLSAEEMTSDPVFGRSAGGDITNAHLLLRIVDGVDQCPEVPVSLDPCDFVTCGAGGLCMPTPRPGAIQSSDGLEDRVAACACLPGATARAASAPDGSATIICQDGRMSFLNPGEREVAGAEVLPDTCAGFDCGEHGQCVTVNLTPTCVCDRGYVALASDTDSGARTITCTEPSEAVPSDFYEKRLAALPPELPGGREVALPDVMPVAPAADPYAPLPEPTASADFPMPRVTPGYEPPPRAPSSSSDGGCTVAHGTASGTAASGMAWLAALALAATRLRRQTRR
jgi:hypothetical protein